MTQRIVINTKPGGFGLSPAAIELYKQLSGLEYVDYYDIPRDCEHLVKVVTQLGSKANNRYSQLKVVEIPQDVVWQIDEYDSGVEWVAEVHRTWS